MKIFFIVIIILIIAGIFFYLKNPSVQPITRNTTPSGTVTPTVKVTFSYAFPVDNFFQRLTKKPFGIYVTPKNSPVKPEKFLVTAGRYILVCHCASTAYVPKEETGAEAYC